jgi:hypothetical protein
MTWLSASETDKAIIQEIETQTDRAAALIAVAYLEERLRSALDARTHRHANVEKEIYRSSGPLDRSRPKLIWLCYWGSGRRTSALVLIPDSSRTSSYVRKVPILLQKSLNAGRLIFR